jgi:hypothetical protein
MGKKTRMTMPRHGPKAVDTGRSVWFFLPHEKSWHWKAVDAVLDLAAVAAVGGAKRIKMGPTRIDVARNRAARKFLEVSRRPKDTLVMLDADHEHPKELIDVLVSHDKGVVAALCFRRSEPYDPQIYVRDKDDGELKQPVTWGKGVLKGTIVGTGAIAIQRWVFEKLEADGFSYPWFRMMYTDGEDSFLGEDWYFGLACEKAGIEQWCDMGFVSPHIADRLIAEADYRRHLAEHPEILDHPEALGAMKDDWFGR